MATNKNITMKQFNGTDYDILYPKTIASQIPDVYSKTEVLTTETLSKYGLTADKLPNDVFQQIKTLIDNAQASADGKARIQSGSYVGTGTYGANNPCSLTFDFVPKIVWIYARYPSSVKVKENEYIHMYQILTTDNAIMPTDNLTTNYVQGAAFGSNIDYGTSDIRSYGKCSSDRKTIYWYNTCKTGYAAGLSFNGNGSTYYYLAIE